MSTHPMSFRLFFVLELLHDVLHLLCEGTQYMGTHFLSTVIVMIMVVIMVVVMRVMIRRMIYRSRRAGDVFGVFVSMGYVEG